MIHLFLLTLIPLVVCGVAANRSPKDLDGDGLLTIFDYNIVISAQTSAAFESGEVEALKVF